MRVKLMADYFCPPLWWDDRIRIGPIELDEMHLPDGLKAELAAWAARFDATLDAAYPPDSGFASPEEEAAFHACGRDLAGRVAAALGDGTQVRYWSPRDA